MARKNGYTLQVQLRGIKKYTPEKEAEKPFIKNYFTKKRKYLLNIFYAA